MEKPITDEEAKLSKSSGTGKASQQEVDAIRADYRMWLDPNFEGAPKNKYKALQEIYGHSFGKIHNILKGKGAYKNVWDSGN